MSDSEGNLIAESRRKALHLSTFQDALMLAANLGATLSKQYRLVDANTMLFEADSLVKIAFSRPILIEDVKHIETELVNIMKVQDGECK